MRKYLHATGVLVAIGLLSVSAQAAQAPAHGAPGPKKKPADGPPMTPQQSMQSRFPQPVMTGRLIGMTVHDEDDRVLGSVSQVVRMDDNSIKLIVPYRSWFGWMPRPEKKKPVAVPLEMVAILANHINTMDFGRENFEKAPAWRPGVGNPMPAGETISIALARR